MILEEMPTASFGADASVCPDLKRELVVVGNLTDTSIFNAEVDFGDGGEYGVNRDHADGMFGFLFFSAET